MHRGKIRKLNLPGVILIPQSEVDRLMSQTVLHGIEM